METQSLSLPATFTRTRSRHSGVGAREVSGGMAREATPCAGIVRVRCATADAPGR